MLKKIIKDKNAQIILKMLLKNQLAVIISYPSYEIISHSEQLSPGSIHVGNKPRDILHDMSRFAEQFGKDAQGFRLNHQTSNWLVLFERHSLSSIELFKLSDIPIIHNNKLIGILCLFKEVLLDNLLLINKFISKNLSDQLVEETSNDSYCLSQLEKEILLFAALNKSNKQIASLEASLGIRTITQNTIKSMVSQRIYKKLGVDTIDAAIFKAIESQQLDTIPDSILDKSLKDYYLLDVNDDCIIL